jgi:hypothetical protein
VRSEVSETLRRQKCVQNPAYLRGQSGRQSLNLVENSANGLVLRVQISAGLGLHKKRPLVDMSAAGFVVQFCALPNAEQSDFGYSVSK